MVRFQQAWSNLDRVLRSRPRESPPLATCLAHSTSWGSLVRAQHRTVSLFRDVCMPRPRMSAAAAIVSKSARSALDSRGVGHRAATHEALSKLSASGAARSGCGGLLALWPLGGGLAMIYLSWAHRLRCWIPRVTGAWSPAPRPSQDSPSERALTTANRRTRARSSRRAIWARESFKQPNPAESTANRTNPSEVHGMEAWPRGERRVVECFVPLIDPEKA